MTSYVGFMLSIKLSATTESSNCQEEIRSVMSNINDRISRSAGLKVF